MERLDAFTIRVYGILIHNNQLMRLKEPFWGEVLYKMPGGGLEFGEGTLQCLARELKEELNLTLDQAELFYVQEDFIRSKFKTNEQLFTVYYKISCKNISDLQIIDKNIEEVNWINLDQLSPEDMSLPVDKIVVGKLLRELKN
ncbi:NUDIX domain-containing protein [Ornithobacterium rhinotracheale]|uniref:NUDIX domain-containing protein n=1 Tax=Ornithobacterium rhinotracheale TaxID=28251 RepID=UPI0040363EF8